MLKVRKTILSLFMLGIWFLAVNHCVLNVCEAEPSTPIHNTTDDRQHGPIDPCSEEGSHSGCEECCPTPVLSKDKVSPDANVALTVFDSLNLPSPSQEYETKGESNHLSFATSFAHSTLFQALCSFVILSNAPPAAGSN